MAIIDINVPSEVSQTITDGVPDKAPSENAVYEALLLKQNIETKTTVSDDSHTITGTGDQTIAFASITADRTVSLPTSPINNQRIWITDESGLCSNARRIIVAPGAGHTIAGDSFAVINFPNGSGYLEFDGVNKWQILSTTAIQFSAGVNTAPSVTDNGDGTITVGTGVYALFANTNGIGRPKAYQVTGGTFTLVDNSTNFIYANYDTSTGVVSLQQTTSESNVNGFTQILIYAAYRQGLMLHPRVFDNWGVALPNKLNQSIYKTQRVRLEEGGVILGESASPAVRTLTISAGTAWIAAAETPLVAITSAANTCYHVIQTAPGVWSTNTVVTQYNNTQYNTTAGLQTLTNNRYAVNFVYRSIGLDNDMAIVLGQGNYSLGEAQVAPRPSNLPAFLQHMTFIGRVIVQKNSNTATQIDQYNQDVFTTTGITDHEALSNLLGGAANDHYHLTAAQLANIAPLVPRVQSITSAATVTPTTNDDIVVVTAQAAALTIANPTGTPVQGQVIMLRILDNGTARSITWGAIYRAIGFILPTTTVLSKVMYMTIIYNATATKWDVVGIAREL